MACAPAPRVLWLDRTNDRAQDDYKDSAYIYVGGLDYELTEGDVVTIFSQFGEGAASPDALTRLVFVIS